MDNRKEQAEYIKYLVRRTGTSFADLADTVGISRSAVQNAIHHPIFIGEQVIAEFLNIHPMLLWPERYDDNGKPLHPQASANNLIPFSPECKEKENGGRDD